jgi:hypothetical protein
MPVTATIDPDTGIARYSVTGEVIRAEVCEALDQVYADPMFRAPWRSIWDVSEATPRINADDLRAIMSHVEARRPVEAGRVAIVATEDLVFGLGRMYELLAGDMKVKTAVFRDSELARQWLMHDDGDVA